VSSIWLNVKWCVLKCLVVSLCCVMSLSSIGVVDVLISFMVIWMFEIYRFCRVSLIDVLCMLMFVMVLLGCISLV